MTITFNAVVKYALDNNASDIHIQSGNQVAVRKYGQIQKITKEILTKDSALKIIAEAMTEQQMKDFKAEKDLDFAYMINAQTRLRMNVFCNLNGVGCVGRIIKSSHNNLQDLKAPEVLIEVIQAKQGLILVTGPTGSGKSSTINAMVNLINQTRNEHIITIEDPIEFVYNPLKCIINQREVGRDTKSFAAALKGSLREDPDVIVVGEMRDLETIRLALDAAETGHLVMGTLHTNSAPKTIDRVVSVFPSDEQETIRAKLSTSIHAVISQRLLPLKTGAGRVAAFEILVANSAIRNLIKENKLPQIEGIMQINKAVGMITMHASIENLVSQGLVSNDIAKHATGSEE